MAVDEKKLKEAQKSRMAKTKINHNAKLKEQKKDPKGTKYRCTCCGEQYDAQYTNFFKSPSMLFVGNNGYLPICKTCLHNYFDYVAETFDNNEIKALQVLASICDIYYCDEMAAATENRKKGTHRLSSFIGMANLAQYANSGRTYLDTIKELSEEIITDYADVVDEEGNKKVSTAAIDRFGLGFTPEEYSFMTSHYKSLKTQVADDDPLKEVYIKELCVAKVIQSRALAANDVAGWEKGSKAYQQTAKTAGLRVRSGDDETISNEEACWGNFIKDVEAYAPAELYEDTKLFKDVDEITDYWERFIVRPFRNFFTGDREMDKEFVIHAGDDAGG